MKLRLLAASLAAVSLASGAVAAQDISSERGKLSYAIGYNAGVELADLAGRGESVDVSAFIKAVQDAYARKEPAVPRDQLRAAVEGMQQRQQAKLQEEFTKQANANKASSDAFLAQHAATSGLQTVAGTNIKYRVVESGNGARPSQSSDLQLTFKSSLHDGTVLVDTAQPREGQAAGPISVKLSQIPLPGLREVLAQMPAGARWEFVLPADKAYGTSVEEVSQRGARSLPEAALLINQAVKFDVKLVSVK